ncbi:hypothetical protein MTBBW1_1140012 [Desulfamplus magnetovallimortis]|uniref:Uncharacterized protein n=1 Tax=Desulfamplus magnetovallimortis TaxID=1246637 RepID=A0A1W1H5U2_9BACT|nr:hypothetical protein MTBBW1_1140012 [Desulfamplus magnetovallimortis]
MLGGLAFKKLLMKKSEAKIETKVGIIFKNSSKGRTDEQ